MLGAYDYHILYRQGSANANADALSRLPFSSDIREVPQPAEVVHLMQHLASTPLTSAQIKMWTDQDSILSKVRQFVLDGWPEREADCGNQDLSLYFRRRLELGVEVGCVVRGCRVVVPRKGRA